MRLPELAELLQWLEDAGVDSFEMKQPGSMIRVVMQRHTQPIGLRSRPEGQRPGSAAQTVHQVIAQVRGTFLAAHPLRTAALTEVGATVTASDVLGLVRSGGVLYHPIVSGKNGRVNRRLVSDGDLVEPGMPLFELQRGKQ